MNALLLIVSLLIQTLSIQSQTGIVTGQVLSADGAPAVGVRVTAVFVPEPGQPAGPQILASITLTDSSGRYRLENILPGRFHIMAGFLDVPTYYPGVASPAAAVVIGVIAGNTAGGIDFRLAVSAGVNVNGRVVLVPNPNVPPNSRVALMGSGRPLQETAVNADGSFEFSRVRPGVYNLRLNFAPMSTLPPIVVADRDITRIEVSVVVPPIEIAVVRDMPVRVVVNGGGPLPRIGFLKTDTGPVITFAPRPDGTFHVPLLTGDHPVAVTTALSGYSLTSLTYGSFDLLAGMLKIASEDSEELRITLGPNKPNAWVKVNGRVTGLAPGAELSLYLTPSEGLPLATARPAGGGPSNIVAANKIAMTLEVPGAIDVPVGLDGTFEVPAVLQGTYKVSMSATFPAPLGADSSGLRSRMDTSATIVVRNEDLTGVEIRVPPQKEVAGRVMVENGNPQPTFRLMLTGGAAPLTLYPAAEPGGTFRVNLPEGDYRLAIGGLPAGYSVRSLTYGTTNLLSEPLKVSRIDTADLRIVLGAQINTVRISGRVVGPGSALSGVSAPNLRRISIAGEMQQDQALGVGGAFEFPKVIPGHYNVRLSVGSFSGDISIAANTAADIKDLTFVPVSGRVEVEGGAAHPPSYSIEARNTNRDLPSMTSTTHGAQQESRLRPDGSFSIVLTEGEQEIRVADLPDDYEVKSIRYGSTDALGRLLKIGPNDPPAELRIAIGLRNKR